MPLDLNASSLPAVGPSTPAAALKQMIRERWSTTERVAGWTGSDLNAEFQNAACRRAWLEVLGEAVGSRRGLRALDVGTGPGTIAQLWRELGCATTGIDLAPAMVEAAKQAAAARSLKIKFLEGDAEEPPFEARSFDVVSSRFVLFTLPHPGYAIRRWKSLLRAGGTMVLIGHERSGDRPPRHANERPAASPLEERHREVLRQLPFVDHTAKDLQVVMEAAGLKDIRRIPVDPLETARAALRAGAPGIPEAVPFVLAGRK